MATLTKAHADQIAELIADHTDTDGVLRASYSGRGMYGRSCVGFIAEPAIVLAAFASCDAARAGEIDVDLFELANEMRTDSMGYDTITYLPDWTVED
jgi:hypothetical protein